MDTTDLSVAYVRYRLNESRGGGKFIKLNVSKYVIKELSDGNETLWEVLEQLAKNALGLSEGEALYILRGLWETPVLPSLKHEVIEIDFNDDSVPPEAYLDERNTS